jgi:hypothetical protein
MRPYISEILAKLAQLPHPGQRRELLKVLMFFEPQEMDMGILFNLSYSLFTNPDESLANIVHSMQILYNISQIETELKPELLSTIELMLPQSKAGFKSRGGKLAKKLRKQIG